MTHALKSAAIIAAGILCYSCASTKVKVNTPYANGLPVDTLNLVSTMIGPVWQPVLPLIDAAAFNEKTNKIADQILDEEQRLISSYQSVLVEALEQKLLKVVRTGTEFASGQGASFKVDQGLAIDNKNFPVVFFAEGDMNVAEFGKGKNINEMFKNSEEIKANVTKLAAALNLKSVLISYNRLSVVGVGPFGASGTLRLESYLFLYRANGDLLMDAYGWTKPTPIKGRDLAEYKVQLDNFRGLAQLLSQELTKYIK